MPEDAMRELLVEMERLEPSSLAARLDRDRPYDGQVHTFCGQRGFQGVHGLSVRDVQDCFVRACYDASGLEVDDWPGLVSDLPWGQMSPIAVSQNLCCWLERYMGTYPNLCISEEPA